MGVGRLVHPHPNPPSLSCPPPSPGKCSARPGPSIQSVQCHLRPSRSVRVPLTTCPAHPMGFGCRSPDPQTPVAALVQGSLAPLLGPRAPSTHIPPTHQQEDHSQTLGHIGRGAQLLARAKTQPNPALSFSDTQLLTCFAYNLPCSVVPNMSFCICCLARLGSLLSKYSPFKRSRG